MDFFSVYPDCQTLGENGLGRQDTRTERAHQLDMFSHRAGLSCCGAEDEGYKAGVARDAFLWRIMDRIKANVYTGQL